MDGTKRKLLVADDDKEIREALQILFAGDGYAVVAAKDGMEAVELTDETVDLIILDVNMPKKSGVVAAMEIRKKTNAPMLFLTAYSQDSDKTLGYSAGADDYMTKPFSNSELLLKVKALLRRCYVYQPTEKEAESVIQVQDLSIDRMTQQVYRGEELMNLTYTEYKILELLATNRKRIFSIEHIYTSVWEDEVVGDSAVMVHIKNLRKKLECDTRNPSYIKTAWGKGYYVD